MLSRPWLPWPPEPDAARRPTDARRQAGAISLALLSFAGLSLLVATWAALCLLWRGESRAYALFDEERRSPLYCAADVAAVARLGPASLNFPTPAGDAATESERTCLLRRLDYAAPGGHGDAPPEATCAVLARLHLPTNALGGRPCR